jgi:hypothetical protein
MEYTMSELKELVKYIDAQLQDQAPYFDDRLLTKQRNIKQAIKNIEAAEAATASIREASQYARGAQYVR